MRGVEAALLTWRNLSRSSSWGETLQAVAPDLEGRERRLAESLLFRGLRRRALWLFLVSRLSRRGIRELPAATGDALILGLAGIVEMPLMPPRSLINAFVQRLALQGDEAGGRLVNGLLRRCHEEGIGTLSKLAASGDLRDQALLFGFPDEGLSSLRDSWGSHEAKRIMKLLSMRPLLSWWNRPPARTQARFWPSPEVEGLVRSDALLEASVGADVLLQSETSARLTPFLKERLPQGEGLSVGEPHEAARLLSPEGKELPLWNETLPPGTIPAGYVPVPSPPSDRAWVRVDAPSSESGRWARLPERKWTFRRSHLADLARKQERLLAAALGCLAPGGIALYRTSSLFKEENEQIVARALASRSDVVEWALDLPRDLARRGRPWGYYVLPETPWAEGTFVAVLMRRS